LETIDTEGGTMVNKVDEKRLRTLLEKKVPQREMARQLKIPRSSLQRLIKSPEASPSSEASVPVPENGVPVVDAGKLTPAEVEAVRADFWELIAWWRERKMQQVYASIPRETQRQTYHVEKEYIRLIHREAEGEGVSITEVVNRAFRAYFEGKLYSC
jgi:hypothetical protein